MSELASLLQRHAKGEMTLSAIPRLFIGHSKVETGVSPVVTAPMFCVIATGRKRIYLGTESFYYDPETYLVGSADLPVSGQVIAAPYLGCALVLDARVVADMLAQVPALVEEDLASPGLAVGRLDDGLMEPVLRLLRLLDQPADIPVLAPLIEREILYRLLQGARGAMIRQFARPMSRLAQVSRAIAHIRNEHARALPIEELASLAHMSAPSFHRHFRAVTLMSPHQFQKRIRLQEARRLLLSGREGAADVAFRVGYESPSQFSREYRKLFGAPPSRDQGALAAQSASVLPAARARRKVAA